MRESCSVQVRMRTLGAAIVMLLTASGVADAATSPRTCSVTIGQRVVLAAAAPDPDVFVWDARQRMLDYALYSWRNTREVTDHTAIAYPGTVAIVVRCDAEIVRFKTEPGVQDAVGIRIISGPNRGVYGWVVGDEVHKVKNAP